MTIDSPVFDTSIQKLREQIENKTGKSPEQLYEEREKRVRDAIELREPDRVPISIIPDPTRLGLTRAAAYYDPVAWKEAVRKQTLDFEPDLSLAGFGTSGLSLEALDVRNKLWPGGPLPPDYEYQFVEGEYMKEDEYDLFLSDPSDFVIRYYLPRVYGALQPLAKLPPVSQMYGNFEFIATLFASPEFENLGRALRKAGKALEKYRLAAGNAQEELALLGFPAFSHRGGVGGAPFDTISSAFRGMKGSMLDMYRQPEKLIRACDAILEKRISMAVPADPHQRGNPKRVGMPLWRGDKKFMSDRQFEKFYWPGLKKAISTAIGLGYVPIPFFEAEFGERLGHLLEFPKGKVVANIEHMDIVKAKEILGGHTCILAKAPPSLKYASVQEAQIYYKKMIKDFAKGGGFMLRVTLPDKATNEELRQMFDSIREYGQY